MKKKLNKINQNPLRKKIKILTFEYNTLIILIFIFFLTLILKYFLICNSIFMKMIIFYD